MRHFILPPLLFLAALSLSSARAYAAGGTCSDQFQSLWQKTLTGREVALIETEYKRTLALITKLDQPLSKNPELEMGVKRTYSGGPGGNGWEAGLSQEFEVAGQAAVRRRLAELRRREASLKARLDVLEVRSKVRTAFIRFQSSAPLLEHLSEHTEQLRTWEARGFPRDVRMGPYTGKAGRAALAILETNMNRTRTDMSFARTEITRIIGTAPEVSACDTGLFPDLPSVESLDVSQGAVMSLLKNRIEVAQEERTLAGLNAVPSVSVFLFGGSQTAQAVFPSATADRENYVRFGLRIPLPVFDTGAPAKTSSDAVLEGARREMDGAARRWIETVRLDLERYQAEKQAYVRLARVREEGRGYSGMLETAYLSGRITFYEFWGEHDRWHELENQYAETAVRLAQSLGRIESGAGITLEEAAMPAWLASSVPDVETKKGEEQ
ncbi:MAG: TolC family protein [Spirochaetia bacterium]|nr:TolC family protein [Spirochaetia bacterium]